TDPAVQLRLLFVKVAGRPLLPSSAAIGSKAHEVLRLRNGFAHPKGPIGASDGLAVLVHVKSLIELLAIDAAVEESDGLTGVLRRLQAEQPAPAPEEPADPAPTPTPAPTPAPTPTAQDESGQGVPGSPEPAPSPEDPTATVPEERPDVDTGRDEEDVPLPPGLQVAGEVDEVQGEVRL